jgi:hypothetical protein
VFELCAFDVVLIHLSDEGGDGVTQQVEFLKTALVSRVNREFRWWKGKDKPVVSNINVRKLQNVSDECAVFGGIGAIDNRMASRIIGQNSF